MRRQHLFATCICLACLGDGCSRETPVGASPPTLLEAGRYADGEVAARAELDARRAVHGLQSSEALQAAETLLRALIANGKASDSLTVDLAVQTLAARESRHGVDSPDVVASLINLVDVLVVAADYERAIALASRAVAIREKEGASRAQALTEALDHLGRALSAARRHDDALEIFERALALKEVALGPDAASVARTLEDIALVLQRKAAYADSGKAIRRALAIQESLETEHPAYATTLNLLAQQLWFEGDILASREASERAVRHAERALRADHPIVALSLRYLAATLFDLGETRTSRELTERALAIAQRNFGPNHHVTAEYLNDLGYTELDEGNYPVARQYLQQALEIYQARYGETHEYVASTLSVLARVDARMGDLVRAREEQARSVAIHTGVGGPNHPFVATSLTELANVYREQGYTLEAIRLLERALTIRERIFGSDHRDVAVTMANLAAAMAESGRTVQAQALAERAVNTWRRLGALDAPEYAVTLDLYANLQEQLGHHANARVHFERALAIRGKVLGSSHPLHAETLVALARALAGAGEMDRAIEAATRAEAAGRDHMRLLLHSLPERQALNYATARPNGLNLLLTLAVSTPSAVKAALDSTIRSRALVLDEVAGRNSWSRAAGTNLEDVRARLDAAQQRLANLTVRGQGLLSVEQYRALLDRARMESESAEQMLAERSAQYRADRARAAVGLDAVTSALPEGTALVSFVRYDAVSLNHASQAGQRASPVAGDPHASSYLAFVLRPPEAPVAVALGSARHIDAMAGHWRADIHAALLPNPRSALHPAADVSGTAFRRQVWDRLAPYLEKSRRVFIVPDGTLNIVPLAALPMVNERYLIESGPDIHYLSAERDVTSVPSHTMARGLLALGDPAFGDAPQRPMGGSRPGAPGYQQEMARGASMKPGCSDFRSVAFDALQGTGREVQEIADLWRAGVHGNPEPTRVRTGIEAAEDGFKQDAPRQRILHLATHGFFLDGACLPQSPVAPGTRGVGGLASTAPAQNPLRLSGLALAGANRRAQAKPDEDDGILTAEEVAMLDLQGVEWAVLSACDTGVGEIKAGEGVFGLRRAFQVAGARTVIMSLWSVEDQATRAWMRALYEGRFQRNLSTADAVHQASLTVLRDRRARGLSTHPFFWAAFVAAGDWR